MGISLSRQTRHSHGDAIAPNHELLPGAYLTDELHLYFYLGLDGAFALLEDCRSLEVIACSAAELELADLRVVVQEPPSSAHEGHSATRAHSI